MAFTIQNLTTSPMWLTLTSGEAIRLSPGATSAELDDVEKKDNAKLESLQAQHVIAIDPVEAISAAVRKPKGAAKKPAHARAEKKSKKSIEKPLTAPTEKEE